MKQCLRALIIVLGIQFCISAYSLAQAATYYVAPSGNNTNPGTISQPFATLQKAHDVANPGDTIYMRGGIYPIATQTVFSRSGSSGNRIMVFNYPGETPILDGSSWSPTAGYALIRLNNASWWWIKGLELKSSPGHGIFLYGASTTNNIIEFCNVHHNVRLDPGGAGIQFDASAGGNNLILNNDVHHSSTNQGSGTGGDGIGNSSAASGNVIRGNRVWRNHDDGIDLWNGANVLVEDNWSWENGYDDNLQPTTGNGTGFKLGGGTGDGNHMVRNNLAWRNKNSGVDDNGADIPMVLYNNTAYENARVGGSNFAFYTAIANVLRNNLAYNPNGVSFNGAVVQDHNSWNLPVTVTSADFVTLDFTANIGARQADGSLPVSSFLQLVSSSDLIDKGVNVGITYTGSAPDLGTYEYVNPAAPPQAPSSLQILPVQ